MKITQENAARVAALIYTGGSLAAALVFFAAATLGGYGWVARLGGAGWVFALAMIILMPTVTPFLRERAGLPASSGGHGHN
jgi:hypothetical protein